MGLGNTLNCDEGLGVQLVKQLDAQLKSPSSVEFLDGGVLGLNLLPIVEDCSHLLVLDAIDAGEIPGTVIELRRDEIPLYAGVKLSQHQITFQEVLGLANIRGYLPEHLHMIGIQPADLSVGVEISSVVVDAFPEALKRAHLLLKEWGLIWFVEGDINIMDYLYLDAVSWEYSQAIYHAAAYLGREVLILLRPSTPYVCIGFHQDAQQEIDLAFAKENNIPVFRREVGGGAVYLDGDQLFYQVVMRKDNPAVPAKINDFYKILLQPVIDTYHQFGVKAQYKPVNDIIVNGRKISGTGAAQIEDMMILVGNFLQDFNFEMMTRVLRVPDEKFRDKVFKTMSENLTTFKKETGKIPANDDLAADLLPRYESIFGKMRAVSLDDELIQKAESLMEEMNTSDWLLANDKRRPDISQVKIAEGIYVIQKMVKTPGGLIRVTAVNNEGILNDVHISGDFFFFPSDGLEKLEETLDGVAAEASAINQVVEKFYKQFEVESPGVTPRDFAQVLSI